MIEKIDEKLYNKDTLSLLNIHELREIGRKFGVPSPTTLSKKKLVDYILKIVYGEIKPSARTNFGRPSQDKFDIPNCIEKIKRGINYSNDLCDFNLNTKLSAPVDEDSAMNILQGIYQNNLLSIKLEDGEFIKLPQDLVLNLKLEDLDVIEFIMFNNHFKIISVNGIKFSDTNKEIKIFNETLKNGFVKTIHYTNENIYDEIKNVLSKIKKEQVVLFSCKDYNGLEIKHINYDKNGDYSQIYKKLIQFISLCEDAINTNGDLIAIIDDKKILSDAINSFDDDIKERIKNNLNSKVEIVKNLGDYLIIFSKDEEITY